MNHQILRLFLFLPLVSGVCEAQNDPDKASTNTAPNLIVYPLKAMPRELGFGQPMPITGSFQADKSQTPSSQGLQFQIDLVNQGDEALRLFYFLDYLKIRITDHNGQAVQLPKVRSRFDSVGHMVFPSFDVRKFESPYRIDSFTIDGRQLSPQEISDAQSIVMPARGRIKLQIAIDRIRVVKESRSIEGKLSQEGPWKEIPLPKGTYKIYQEISLNNLDSARKKLILAMDDKEDKHPVISYKYPTVTK